MVGLKTKTDKIKDSVEGLPRCKSIKVCRFQRRIRYGQFCEYKGECEDQVLSKQKKELTFETLKQTFEELIEYNLPFKKVRWTHLRPLYQAVKRKCKILSLKTFHQFLLELWEDRKINLAEGSIVVAHTRRYGMLYDGFYYAYVSIPEEQK